jgi:hypothetical protein
MMQRRAKILCQKSAGESTNSIANTLRHSPKLIREIPFSLDAPSSIFQLCHVIGGPKQAAHDAVDDAECLTHFSRSISSAAENRLQMDVSGPKKLIIIHEKQGDRIPD